MLRDMPSFPCVCCGYLTMSEVPGSFSICPICFWEDDVVQLRFPTMGRGANRVSLIDGQKNYRAVGSCEHSMVVHCRPPATDDTRDPTWRPIDLTVDSFEPEEAPPGVNYRETYPDDLTTLYYWRNNFWRRRH